MNCKYSFKSLGYMLGIFSLGLLLTANANAGWYWVKVKNVAPASVSGDTFVQFTPGIKPNGLTETAFTGAARGIVSNGDAGANKVLAVLLTAISADANVLIQMTNPPAWTPSQVILNAGIEAP